MERLGIIEDLIEVGREEAPRIVAERSREAVETVEAGVTAALASARDRLRPQPRRPSALRLILIGLVTAAALTVLGFVLAAVVERAQVWLRQRQSGGRDDLLVKEAERASDGLERDKPAAGEGLTRSPLAIPVAGSDPAEGDGVPSEERVTAY